MKEEKEMKKTWIRDSIKSSSLMGIEGDVVSCLYEIVSKIRSQVFRKFFLEPLFLIPFSVALSSNSLIKCYTAFGKMLKKRIPKCGLKVKKDEAPVIE